VNRIRYQEAAAPLPDDPRPLLGEGLCYEGLNGIGQSPEENMRVVCLFHRKVLTPH
jgi:hypothetical protein